MAWVTVVTQILMKILKSIFGMSKPRKTTVTHPDSEINVDDGKTDEERLEDFGL